MSYGKTRVSAYAVCAREGRLLLVHQSAPGPAQGSWTLPGGGIDFGESPASAVVREVSEETGGIAAIGELLGTHDSVYRAGDGVERHGIRLLYAASITGELNTPDSGETDAVEWHPVANLPEPTTEWAQLGALLAVGREPV